MKPVGGDDLSGRQAELAMLTAAAGLADRGRALPLLLTGAPGMGKTCLLRAVARTLDDPSTGLRALYAPLAASTEPVSSLAAAILGLAHSPGQVDFERAEALGRAAAGDARGAEAMVRDLLARPPEPDTGSGWNRLFALAGELSRETGQRLVMLLDDIHLIPGPESLVAALGTVDGGPVAWVAASHRPVLPGGAEVNCAAQTIRLEPLDDTSAWEILRRRGAAASLDFGEDCRSALPLLGGVPALVSRLPAAAILAGRNTFESSGALIDFHAAQMTGGYLRDHYRVLLAGGQGDDTRHLLEILLHLLGRGARTTRRELAAGLHLDDRQAARLLDRMISMGIVREEWGFLAVDAARPLEDFCRTQWRLHVEGRPEEECRARLRIESADFLAVRRARCRQRGNVDEFRSFLASWDNQAVPRSLVDAVRFGGLFPGTPPEAEALPDRDTARVILPRVTASWEHDFTGGGRPPNHLDLVAITGPGRGQDSGWLAVDLRLETEEVTSPMVEDFARRLRLFADRDGIADGQLTGWIVTGGIFSAEACQAASRAGLWTSGPEQLRLMAGLTGGSVSLRLAADADRTREPLELRMIIPEASEIELVAARTLEEFGTRLPFREGDLARLKMALVEACLNAFEHGGSEEHAVSLTFRVLPGALEIDIGNRGRAFIPATVVMPSVEEKFGSARKRGWGLALIRELVDEMSFLERDGGTCLRLRKHFDNQTHGERGKETGDVRADHNGRR